MKRLIVSVIIPVYNKEKYIERSIKSVLNQSFTNFEILVIDDGSTDLSAQIIQKLAKEDPRVKHIFKTNGGVSTARNLGIDKARGEYISFLDADDYWLDNFLEEMTESIGECPIAYCGHYDAIEGITKKSRIRFKKGDILVDYINNVTTPHTNSWLIKRSLIEKFSIRFEEGVSWGEDMTFFMKVLIHGESATTPYKFLTVYVNDAEDHLSTMSIDKIYDDIGWMENAIKYINNFVESETLKKRAIDAFRGYRIPAAIIYKLLALVEKDGIGRYRKNYQELESYLSRMSHNNGIRSMKLILMKIKLNKLFRKWDWSHEK